MGSLKPGARYIYERQEGTVYAREFGAAPETRVAIGWDWEPENNPARVRGASKQSIIEYQQWHEILIAAKTDPSLQEAVERVKLIYHLGKQDE
jgi:hypothetical protein